MLSRICVLRASAIVSLAVVGVCCSSACAGPDWVEAGDAGSSFFSAQFPTRPLGITQLDSVEGSLSFGIGEPDYEDMYFFRITNPAAFSLSMEFADFNAVMYLFNVTVNHELYGLLGNDNMNDETLLPRLAAMASDGTGVTITQPGDYVLAVTGAGRVPVSRSGPIFNLASPTEISGADGSGGINPLSGWTGVGEQGRYIITLESADFPAAPAPGTGIVAGLGVMAACRRRRRKS